MTRFIHWLTRGHTYTGGGALGWVSCRCGSVK